jgi:hypothetical protein
MPINKGSLRVGQQANETFSRLEMLSDDASGKTTATITALYKQVGHKSMDIFQL